MRLLDGGFPAWTNAGLPTESGDAVSVRGDFRGSPAPGWVIGSGDLAQLDLNETFLCDARDSERFAGEAEPIDSKAGHIPGARLFPNELMNNAGIPAKFLPKDDLEKLLQAMSINPGAESITYCNSGHLASGGWFIMSELLGNRKTRLYDGSMHEWTLEKQPVNAMKME